MHFDYAIQKLLKKEGGYVDHPADPGGRTNFGISQRSYPHLDIKHLTEDQAKEIYHRDYWQPCNLDMICDQDLAAEILSLVVNIGPARAITLLQQTINRISPNHIDIDGRLGPGTAEAVNQFPHKSWLLAEFKLDILRWYTEHSKSVFIKGLNRRILG